MFDFENPAHLLVALDSVVSTGYATAFLILASEEHGVEWIQNTYSDRLSLVNEKILEGQKAVGFIGIEKKQPLGTGVRFHRILLERDADELTKKYLTIGCQGLEDNLNKYLIENKIIDDSNDSKYIFSRLDEEMQRFARVEANQKGGKEKSWE